MKAKTINKILTGKFISWTKSIEDEATRKLVEDNSIITGGAIVSLLLNEEVSDFDVYFRTPEAALAVAQYYVKKLLENPPPAFKEGNHTVEIKAIMEPATKRVRVVVQSAGIAGETPQKDYQYFEGLPPQEGAQAAANYVDAAVGEPVEGQITDPTEVEAYTGNVEALDEHAGDVVKDVGELKPGKGAKKTPYRVLFVTSNAITLSDQMQLVLRFQGEVDQIHTNYDFVHCTSAWTSWDKKLTLRPEALEAIITKELRYVGSKYPICSLIRTRKFITRGWTINAGQYVKMAYQVSKLDMDDPKVLEDQLVGVDSAYFNQLIAQLNEEIGKRGDEAKVDGTYLMTLIDKIF